MNLIQTMSAELRMEESKIFSIARNAGIRYRRIMLERPGREPRIIWQPSAELRLLQTWCSNNVLSSLPVHPSCFSYVKGKNIAGNARMHASNAFITRLDVRNFFPSIRSEAVTVLFNRWLKPLDLSNVELQLLVSIGMRRGELPIGAPTSPLISNAIMFDFDVSAFDSAKAVGAKYTRYADDLYISSNKPNVLQGLEDSLRQRLESLPNLDLKINEQKTRRASRKRRRRVTGVLITPQGLLSIGRERKRSIRTQIFLALKEHLKEAEVRSLIGMLAYAESVEPQFVRQLETKFGRDFRAQLLRIISPKP